ncbi:inositol-3-phosphate synthase [bacterium]|nr:inositol-3-phosphate synthase [bacterium]
MWMVGALGDIATTVVTGAGAISRGLATERGLVTALPEFQGLDLAPLDRIVTGGHDVRDASPVECARLLAREAQLFPESFVEATREDLEAHGKRIRPGVAFGCGTVVSSLEGGAARARRAAGPRAALAVLRADLRAFREETGVERLVLVHIASTEPKPPELEELATEEGARSLVERGDARVPASVLYALAACDERVPYVNFTPCLGSAAPGLQEAFLRAGVCHMGRDGKTGETLLRSALAPLFLSRNLSVLSWAGFNILGNRDGQVLEEPRANAAKTTGKERVLTSILGDNLGSALTRIDYVPSIGDWKTAWDHVHFEGFLGMRGTLQLTWRAADSSLAAPLVLDLVRLADLASRRGKKGLLPGLACFFKDPTGVEEHALSRQFDSLLSFARELR